MVHHDVWDYDNASAPVLGDITVAGKRIPAVIQANKNGFLFVFDRVTGEPVWPIEERPVPQSAVPGEQLSPTQPFPTLPAPFDRQGLTEDDLIDFTPELNAEAKSILGRFNTGPLYQPPTLIGEGPGGKEGSLILPSAWGAGNWNTGAFDPETGRYYAVSLTMAGIDSLAPPKEDDATIAYEFTAPPSLSNNEEDYPAWGIGPQGLPLLKPPYARITAYDMNTGATLWMAPAGPGPRDHPLLADLDLPRLGSAGRPVMLVTRSLLFLGEASSSLFGQAGVSGPAEFAAYDKDTGDVVWSTELPAGTTGGPVSYEVDGKQIILVPVGNQAAGSSWIAFGVKE
jgi:quinoprotein glucose dehydrogenase